MKILLIGHACGPGMGSEPGFTWNWAQHLSLEHQVRVITHPQFRSSVDEWMLKYPNPNLEFEWVDVKSVLDFWNPTRGERGIRFHYMLWLRTAYKVAQKLCLAFHFDIAHHVSWGTLRAAPPLWQLPIATIWGPIGGGQCAPPAFLKYFGRSVPQEIFRIVSTRSLYFSVGLRKAARASARIFATNGETLDVLKPFAGAKAGPLLDCGLPSDWVQAVPPARRHNDVFTLIWVGRLEYRKALELALEALAVVPNKEVRLLVAGSGPLRSDLEAKAGAMGLGDRVQFLGMVPYSEMQTVFQRADALFFTSLRDSFGSVVLEAMAQGLPVITLNHQGVGTFVPDDAGIKVPVTKPRESIHALSMAVDKMSRDPELAREMQLAAWNFAREQTWDRRAREMSKVYEEVALSRRQHASKTSGAPVAVPTGSLEQ